MDKWQAQQSFWNGFQWPAYDDQTTFTEDDLPSFPHITYEAVDGSFGTSTTLSVSLWNRSTSWAAIKQKSDEIRDALSGGGVLVPVDNGYLWFKVPEETVFSRSTASGSSDELVQRIMLTVSVDFLTE